MTAPPKPRILPATARIEPKRKPRKAQRIKQQRQAAAWRGAGKEWRERSENIRNRREAR